MVSAFELGAIKHHSRSSEWLRAPYLLVYSRVLNRGRGL